MTEQDSSEPEDAPRPHPGGLGGPVLPPSRFGAGYTVGGPPSTNPGRPMPDPGVPGDRAGWQTPAAPSPTNPHEEYRRQAGQRFSGGTAANPPPRVADQSSTYPMPTASTGPSFPYPTAFPAPTPPTPPVGAAGRMGGTPPDQPPHTPTYPQGTQFSPYPYAQPTTPGGGTANVVKIVAAIVGVFLVMFIVRWILHALFGDAAVWVVLVVGFLASGAYLLYRNQNPAGARHWESQLRHGTQAAIARTVTAVKDPSQPSGTGPGWVPPPGSAGRPGSPPWAGYGTGAAPPTQPPPTAPVPPFLQPAPTHAVRPAYGTPAAVTADTGTEAFKSAALLVPSLIAYAVLFTSTSFTSVWQPWWIVTGLNLYFVICVGARVRPGRGAAAVLFGLVGTVLIGLAASPSPDWNLAALLSTKQGYGDYFYSSPPADLLPWIGRVPAIALLFFVVAWGIARRREGSWAVGLIPALLLVVLSIWIAEHQGIGSSGWFGVWLLNVGVFLGGSLACWATEAMFTPRPTIAPTGPHTYS
jgi:FtsH-binding integral membrane protein